MYRDLEARLKPHEIGPTAGALGWKRYIPIHTSRDTTTQAAAGRSFASG